MSDAARPPDTLRDLERDDLRRVPNSAWRVYLGASGVLVLAGLALAGLRAAAALRQNDWGTAAIPIFTGLVVAAFGLLLIAKNEKVREYGNWVCWALIVMNVFGAVTTMFVALGGIPLAWLSVGIHTAIVMACGLLLTSMEATEGPL